MGTLWHDLRYAVRAIVRRPGLTTVAVLTLALGIGANTTVFSWVRSILLDPLPWAGEADRLVEVTTNTRGQTFSSLSYPNFLDLRERSRAMPAMTAHEFEAVSLALPGSGAAERAWAEMTSASFFAVMDVRPAVGRFFHADEDAAELANPVVVLSHRLWQSRLAADPGAVGATVRINEHPFTVIGVAPPGFGGGYSGLAFDLWVPITMQAWLQPGSDALTQRGSRWLNVMGRLAPGATIAAARAEMATVGADLERAYPDNNTGFTIQVEPLRRSANGPQKVMGPMLSVLLLLVAVVLVVACANVANLLLARAEERRRELAVRLSLGAGRGSLVRLLLVEALVIALLGAAGAVVVARASAGLLVSFMPPLDLPVAMQVPIDARVLGFALLLAVVTALLFGGLPAWRSSRTDVSAALREEGRTATASRERGRLRSSLVVLQVALSLVLLVSAALLWRSMRAARSLDLGFDAGNVLLASLDLFPRGLPPEEGRRFQAALAERVAALPGVTSVAYARRVPLSLGGSSSSSVQVEGYEPAPEEQIWAMLEWVSPGYFETMRQPIHAGRGFAATDDPESQRVAVINRALAERYFGGRDPVGGTVRLGPTALTVVGVAGSVSYRRLDQPPPPMLYLPLGQVYRADVTLHVRTAGDPAALAPAVRTAVAELDPALPVFNVRTLAANTASATFQQRVAGTLLAALGMLALAVAGVGLYGVLAHSAARRTHEIGIRVALGAGRRDVFRLMLRDGVRLAAIGIALGTVAALALTRLMSTILLGVNPADPVSYLGAVAVLAVIATVATVVPARRAAAVDPMQALRYE